MGREKRGGEGREGRGGEEGGGREKVKRNRRSLYFKGGNGNVGGEGGVGGLFVYWVCGYLYLIERWC